MNRSPDIDLRHLVIPGTDRKFFAPFCNRCGWEDEPYPIREAALIAAGEHIRIACLASSDGTSDASGQ